MDRSSDYWIGLDLMHRLTKDSRGRDVEAKINLIDWSGEERWAKYEKFQIRKGDSGFQISLK